MLRQRLIGIRERGHEARRRLARLRQGLRLVLTAAVGVLVILAIMMTVIAAASSPGGATNSTTSYLPTGAPATGAEVVRLGVEPIGFNGVSLSNETFQTSFYVWWRWRGKIDPVMTTDVYNSTPSAASFVVNYSYTNKSGQETPIKLPTGEYYQTARISTGVADPFSVTRYPLDNQLLRIRFENNTYDSAQLVYVPDTAHMTRHPGIDVAGWDVTGFKIGTALHQYGTDFGMVGAGPAAARYAQVVYDVGIKRPLSHFLVKLFLPLLIIFSAALGALLIMQDEYDARMPMVATGLLTLIFLQQGYVGDLPATAPGVLMDYIYMAAYFGIAAAFVRTIYTANEIHHLEKERHDFIRGDRITAIVLEASFLGVIGLLILL